MFVSKQEFMRVLSELDSLSNTFLAFEQENERLLSDFQQVSVESTQQRDELSKRVHQLEAVVIYLRHKVVQNNGG